MSEIKKVTVLKEGVLVPIEISSAFYNNMQEASISLLQSFKDPKQALIDIETKYKNKTPFTVEEYSLFVIMNIIKEVESVALSQPDKFVYEKEIDINDAAKDLGS